MKWLAQLFNMPDARSQAQGAREVEMLPDQLLKAIEGRRYDQISPAIQAWCRQDGIHEPGALSQIARNLGWTDQAHLDKLEILAEYYRGNPSIAFDRAQPYVSGEYFDPDLYIVCVVALYQNSQFEDAHRMIKVGDAHIDLLTDRPDYWFMRALICWSVNDMVGVKQAADRMCELAPEDMATIENACGMYLELGDMQGFQAIWDKLSDGTRQPGYAYALNTLAQGDYEAGFARMEARYEMEEAHRYLNKALFNSRRWRGEDLRGTVLLVSAEQGLGDTIQMARYLPKLLTLGPVKVIMETQPETLTLLQDNFPQIEFIVREYAKMPGVRFDYWVGAMSLPHLLGQGSGPVPRCAGYLHVPNDTAQYWHERVPELSRGDRPRVGLAWSGRPDHRADRRRSIPFEQIVTYLQRSEVDFFALQTFVPPHLLTNLINVSEEMVTLADTAALTEEMDLVITVDTSVVHVSGAIGKETWLLLPYRYEWRWGFEGEDNRWYDSVRVLRQRTHGDWANLLDDVFKRRLPKFQALHGRR